MIDRVDITQDLAAMFGPEAEPGVREITRFSFVPPQDTLNDQDDIVTLEHLFKVFNIGDDDGPMQDIEQQYRKAGMVSMSVGHMVDLHKGGRMVRYICAPVGWTQIT